MPRQVRNLGGTGWAHIIIRGINRENLFYDREDYDRFRTTVARFQRECGFELPIMCLMNNHVHFLMKEEDGAFAKIMKKITVSYAAYYNKKYDRVGHVFQDRFRSEPINDEGYFLTVLRYIYQNPQKAGICPAEAYPYTITEPNDAVSGFFETEAELAEYLRENNTDHCLEYDSSGATEDEVVVAMLMALSGCENPQAIQSLDRKVRDTVLRNMKREGISVRQLSRLTGINRNAIQRL